MVKKTDAEKPNEPSQVDKFKENRIEDHLD